MKLTRALCLALCAVMLLGMMPAVTANAAQTKLADGIVTTTSFDQPSAAAAVQEAPEVPVSPIEEQRPISTASIEEGTWGNVYFTTFDDLKELASKTYDSYLFAYYQGEDDLVISENLTLPDSFQVYMNGKALIVNENVTFTTNDYVDASELIINGTMVANSWFVVDGDLTVNGTLKCEGSVRISADVSITGKENIVLGQYSGIDWAYNVATLEELEAALNEAAASTDGNSSYYININTGAFGADFTITKDLTIPSYTFLDLWNVHLIIAEDCTLNLTKYANGISAQDITVKGVLRNDDYIDMHGTLTCSSDASYTGTGRLYVYVDAGQSYTDKVLGLDLSRFSVTDYNANNCYLLQDTSHLIKLDTPTDLKWGVEYVSYWNEDGSELLGYESFDRPGAISWHAVDVHDMDVAMYQFTLICKGESQGEDQIVYTNRGFYNPNMEWVVETPFEEQDLESGTYYFTVQAVGDGETTLSSDVATSSEWTYVNPGKKLPTPTGLNWQWPYACWTDPADTSLIDEIFVGIFYSKTADGEPYMVGGWSFNLDYMSYEVTNGAAYVFDDILRSFGNGYYYFDVQFQSHDITVIASGDVSELSPAYHLENAEELLTEDVIRIYGDNRIATSHYIASQLMYTQGVNEFDTIIVASALNFPDALTGSYLAAVKDAPILLTYDKAHNETLSYISYTLAEGGTVYILGGESAVAKSFEDELTAMGINVKRLAGKNRFGTNLEILKEAGVSAEQEVLICTATGFADSLSASAAGLPILLVDGSLTQEQKDFLATTSGKFVIIGGKSAVSEDLEAELKALGSVERLGGNTRYETSVMVAQRFVPNPDAVVLAYARNYPDGLCGGPLAVAMNAALILTDDYYPEIADAYVDGIKKGVVVGGPVLISDSTIKNIFELSYFSTAN